MSTDGGVSEEQVVERTSDLMRRESGRAPTRRNKKFRDDRRLGQTKGSSVD